MPTAEARGRRWLEVSLRARLTWVFALAMAAVLTGLGAFLYLRLGTELLHATDRNLGSRADALTAALATDLGAPLGGGHRFVDPDEAFAQVLSRSGRILDSTPGAAQSPLLSPAQAAGISGPTAITRPHREQDDADRLLAVPTLAGGRQVVAVVGETLGDRRDALRHVLVLSLITGTAALLLSSAAGWLLAGAALRPVEAMRRRAAQLSHDHPDERLPVPQTGDELTRLALTLNDLLARLHATVEREHRFVDDASHELRTPLAVLKAELDLTLSRPRSSSELRQTLDAASRETDRLVELAEDLLVLARTRQGPAPAKRAPTHVPTLLAQVLAPLRAEAARSASTIRVDAANVTVDIDPVQTRRAVHNLVENALRHGRGDVTVEASADAGELHITVRDGGPGFPTGLIGTAFEPFTQGPAHDAGTGLGLAIVRAIAAAHDGTVTATNAPTGGARIELHLATRRPPG